MNQPVTERDTYDKLVSMVCVELLYDDHGIVTHL